MFDVIVFTQEELEGTAENIKCICLCDNTFNIPHIPDRKYTAIGKVSASVDCTFEYAKSLDIVFENFEPVFSNKPLPSPVHEISASPVDSSYMCKEEFDGVFVGGYGINLI